MLLIALETKSSQLTVPGFKRPLSSSPSAPPGFEAAGAASFLAAPPSSPSGFCGVHAAPTFVTFPASSSANTGSLHASQLLGCADQNYTPSFSFSPYLQSQPSPTRKHEVAKGVSASQVVTPLRVSYPKQDSEPCNESQVIIPSASSQPSLLKIGEICENSSRFAFEGKVLNRYGTYKLSNLGKVGDISKIPRYLKCDLADQEGFNTITLSIVDTYISLYESKLLIGSFIRVEGPVVKLKNRNDGGTSCYSLHVDATTSILKGEAFECNLSFYPEVHIRDFLEHASLSASQDRKTPLATLAFVVINVDDGSRSGKSSLDLLTIADGPSAHDRASVSLEPYLLNSQHRIGH